MTEVIGLISIILGGVVSILSIIVTYKINKKSESNKEKYALSREVFFGLVEIRNSYKNFETLPDLSEVSASDYFVAALVAMYQSKKESFKETEKAFFKARYFLPLEDVAILDNKIKEISNLEQLLHDTAMKSKLDKKEDAKNIVLRENIETTDDLQKEMRNYIDKIFELEKLFNEILEKRLRKLLG